MEKHSSSRAVDIHAVIEAAGSRLAPSHARALALEAGGATESEIARALGLPAEAVGPLLAVARAKLAGLVACLAFVLFASVGVGVAQAQTPGTDCDCTATGVYVEPDPGVRPIATAVSPGGAYRIEGSELPGPITVRRQSNDAIVLQVRAGSWGWSPDGSRLLISLVTGTFPNQEQDYWLYDLTSASAQTPIWHVGPSALWSSTRLRFSEDGAVFFFAGLALNSQVQLQALEIATGARLSTGFSFYNPPGNLDDDSNPQVAGWGFGPDPTRLAYGYTTGQGSFTRVLANVRTGVEQGLDYTAIAEVALFSPCGDVFAEKVQQSATSGEVTVTLHSTADPRVPLASRGFADGLEVEVRSNATSHVGLLGGTEYPIASNVADDVCSVANQPPVASFAPPAAPVAGSPASFTDTSSDPDGSIVAWHWEFGDGATSSASNPSHTYATLGEYRVRLTVTDDRGVTAVAEQVLRVCGSLATPPGKLLFRRFAGGMGFDAQYDAWALDTASQAVARITNSSRSPSAPFGGARWSPDGTRIAFATEVFIPHAGEGENGIWVMNADGTNRQRITNGMSSIGGTHFSPIWTRDGRWIVFKVQGPTDPGIHFVRPDGTGLTKVPGTGVFDTASDVHPTLTPECSALAPELRDPGCYTLLYVNDPRTQTTQPFLGTIREIRGDGSGLRTLVSELGIYEGARYAPDGSKIAYERFLGLTAQSGGGLSQIWTLDLSAPGAVQRVLVDDPDAFDEDPVWSPDGTTVAYTKGTRALGDITDRDVYVTDFLGCSASPLVAQPGLYERTSDWVGGSVAQAPGSISGVARLHTSHSVQVPTQPLAGVVLELSGDASATTTTAADGSFSFSNLPIGGNFTVRIVSAPDAANTTSDIVFAGLLGSAANVYFRLVPDTVRLEGRVLLARSFSGIEGATVTVEGPGGPYQATTGADGSYALEQIPFRAQFTVRVTAPGYRIEPATRDLFTAGEFSVRDFDFQAYEVPPDGRVAFTSSRDGNDEIYVADLDGRNLANLTNDPAADVEPAISPDGAQIAFASDRNGVFELFVMDALGFEVTPLGVEGREPAWSPDGAAIAFASANGLRSLDLASGAVTDVTTNPSDASPRWDPNRPSVIGFEREIAPGDVAFLEIDRQDPANPQETLVASWPAFDGDPAYRPGGSARAFATDEGFSQPPYVRVEDPANSAYYGLYVGRNPSWSPDGAHIVADDGNGNLWWTERDGARSQRFVTQSGSDRDPDWGLAYVPACRNGIDDDGDGLVDLDDLGCYDDRDPSERTIDEPCDDGHDQDGDGLSDFPADPGCESPYDLDETSSLLVCDNGLDDDGDGLTDYPSDPGCADPVAPSEISECQNTFDDDGDGFYDADDPACGGDPTAPTEFAACQNGIDDDGDGYTDLLDPGCDWANDTSERGPGLVCDDDLDQDGDGLADFPADRGCDDLLDGDETSFRFACDDGDDNDGDGFIDYPADPGCPVAYASPENPPCDDGIDNDGDGRVDFEQPSCTRRWPYWERSCGLGGELVLPYAAFAALMRRRTRARQDAAR